MSIEDSIKRPEGTDMTPIEAAEAVLSERDNAKPAEQQGLFRKFTVARTDGSSEPGGKHHGCEYFVLDVDHDPHAAAALAAYADAAEPTHPLLAADMRKRYGLAALRAALPALREVEPVAPASASAPPSDPLHDDAYLRAVALGFPQGDARRWTLCRIADRIEAAAPPAPAQPDEVLEALSDNVRKGEPIGFLEAIAVINYQENLRRERETNSLVARLKRWLRAA